MDTIVSAMKYYEHLKSLKMYDLWFYKNEDNQVQKYHFDREPYYAILKKNGENTVCDYYRVCRAKKHLKQGVVYTRHHRKNNSVVAVPSIAELAETRVKEICGRTVKVGVEVYYLILGTVNGIVETLFAIPQTELKILVQKLGSKLSSLFADNPIFSYSADNLIVRFAKKGKKHKKSSKVKSDEKFTEKVTNQIKGDNSNIKSESSRMKWYHGTTFKNVNSVHDLDISKGYNHCDFGQGAYFTNCREIAENYLFDDYEFTYDSSKILEAKWCNDSLDNVFRQMLRNHYNNGLNFYDEYIYDNNGNKFKVKVFSKVCKEWAYAILNGWIKGMRVEDCDAVLGPLSHDDIYDMAIKCLKEMKETQIGIEKIQSKYHHKIKDEKIEMRVGNQVKKRTVFQLCCYNPEIITCFSE